ncbi:MAG TPA: hypothetical protein VH678_28050 [Xanthobacteraceae bacterium]|jgi:hypothetical protein
MSSEPAATRIVESEAAPVAPSNRERLEFLNNAIIFAEANIRAFDTKSQIALAAFVFSMTPLWSILNSACNGLAGHPATALLVAAFICTIMLYGFVLWPIRPLSGLVKNKRVHGLFFVVDPMAMSSTYAEKLQDASFEAELTGEVLKLAYIRARKARRFRHALWATGGFYLLVLVAFVLLQRCG